MSRRRPALPALLACAVLFAVSCSSVPKGSEPVTGRKGKAADFSAFATGYFAEGRFAEALSFFSYALNEQVLADNREGIIDSTYDIGRCHLEMGNAAEAEKAFREGLRLSVEENLASRRGRGLVLLGELELAGGDTGAALSLFREAVELLSSLSGEGEKELAVAYHDLGAALKLSGDYAGAEAALRTSLEMNRKAKAKEEEASSLYMLASVLSAAGRYEEAYALLGEALEADRFLERSMAIAQDLYAMGVVSEHLKRTDSAYTSYSQSFMIYQALELPAEAARVLRRLAALADGAGDAERAEKYRAAAEKLEGEGR